MPKGGARPGAGAPKRLEDWRRVELILEKKQVRELDEIAYREKGLNTGRSALVREIIDEGLQRRKKK